MEFEMVQELRSGIKVLKWLYLYDLGFIFIYCMIMTMFADRVHPMLTIPFHIFNVIIGLIFTARSPFNPKKRIWQSLLYVAKKDTNVYHPISNTLAKQPTLKKDTLQHT